MPFPRQKRQFHQQQGYKVMVARIVGAMLLLAAIAMGSSGCGKEDVKDLSDTWVKREADLKSRLDEVKAMHNDIMAKWGNLPAAMVSDTAAATDRRAAEQTLSDHEKKFGEIEGRIAQHNSEREAALTAAKRADFQAAWDKAK